MPEQIRVRPARPDEFGACRMLLPPELERAAGTEYLVAVQDQAPYILGAASYIAETQATQRIRVRVIRTHRRQGIGMRLMRHIEELSNQRGARLLSGASDSVTEPEAQPFLTSLGFQFLSRATTVRAPLSSLIPLILPLEQRLLKRSHQRFTVVPMADAPMNEVTLLYRTELARSPWTTAWSLLDAVSNPRYADSPVLLADGRLAGFLLFHIHQGASIVPARVVAPEFKGSPANVLLIAAGIRISQRAGVDSIEFEIPQDNSDTEKLARRLSCQQVRTKDMYFRNLEVA